MAYKAIINAPNILPGEMYIELESAVHPGDALEFYYDWGSGARTYTGVVTGIMTGNDGTPHIILQRCNWHKVVLGERVFK